jgi:hypothetical protein
MRPRPFRLQLRRSLALVMVALLGQAFLTPVVPSVASTEQPPRHLVQGGFSEGSNNSYAWSMAWFKGKLYVGTARSQLCVESATYDFYFPGKGYRADPAPDLHCPADRYDLDLRAQIWQYTPTTDIWRMVYQAPADIPNPRAPGKFVARDIGYRGMTVYTEPSGKKALYIGGVTADEYIPEIAAAHPPRLLRTTDGETFSALGAGPGLISTPFGRQRAMGFRALTPYRGRLYVTATGGLTGDGVVMEVRRPAGRHPRFVQVSPSSMTVFDMQVFQQRLYLGAGSSEEGYSVWRTGTKARPTSFVPVVTGGAGRGSAIDSVVSMQTYKGRLYVGASGWKTLFPGSELIRISRDDRWDVVVGNPRVSEGSPKWPTSGLFDGFGNVFNGHFWRMSKDRGGLYLGTNDWSWVFRNFPFLDTLLSSGYGFDLYGTCDGTTWSAETTDGFGDGRYNFGLRTMASAKRGFLVGTANHAQGTSVWGVKSPRCTLRAPIIGGRGRWLEALRRTTAGNAPAAVPTSGGAAGSPALARADLASCGTVISWQPATGAKRYVVSRATTVPVTGVSLEPPPPLPNGFRLSSGPTAVPSAGSAPFEAAGPYVEVGVTTGTSFVDRDADPGVRYQYSVAAEDGSSLRGPSTLVGRSPANMAAEVRSTIAALVAHGKLSEKHAGRLVGLLAAVENAPAARGRKRAALLSLGAEVSTSAMDSTGAEDLGAAVFALARSTVALPRGCER